MILTNESKKELSPGAFVLSSILTSYPAEDFRKSIEHLLEDESIQVPQELQSELIDIISDEAIVEDLRSDYIQIFEHSKSLNPIYETEYGKDRSLAKANELSDIAGFYHAFGFELDHQDGVHEMVDHISVELEFYSLLKMKYLYLLQNHDKNGVEIVKDGIQKFLTDHLGRFVTALQDRPDVKNHTFYQKVFNWINNLIDYECNFYDAKPLKLELLSSQAESEIMCCGATTNLNK